MTELENNKSGGKIINMYSQNPTFPWLLSKTQTFPDSKRNSLTFPVLVEFFPWPFPDLWQPEQSWFAFSDTFRMFLSCCKTRYNSRPKWNSYEEIFPIMIDDRSGGSVQSDCFRWSIMKSRPIPLTIERITQYGCKIHFIYNTTIPQDTNWSRSGLSGSGCYRSWIDCHTLCTIICFKYTNESVS